MLVAVTPVHCSRKCPMKWTRRIVQWSLHILTNKLTLHGSVNGLIQQVRSSTSIFGQHCTYPAFCHTGGVEHMTLAKIGMHLILHKLCTAVHHETMKALEAAKPVHSLVLARRTSHAYPICAQACIELYVQKTYLARQLTSSLCLCLLELLNLPALYLKSAHL